METEKIYPFNFEYDRLRASYSALNKDVGSGHDRDSSTLFFIRCYHLCDALIVSGYDKDLVYPYVRQSRALSLCKDLANTLKHKKPRGGITSLGEFDPISRHKDWLDGGKVKTCIHPIDQTFPMDAQELAHQCLQDWQSFFNEHSLRAN